MRKFLQQLYYLRLKQITLEPRIFFVACRLRLVVTFTDIIIKDLLIKRLSRARSLDSIIWKTYWIKMYFAKTRLKMSKKNDMHVHLKMVIVFMYTPFVIKSPASLQKRILSEVFFIFFTILGTAVPKYKFSRLHPV